MFPSYETSYFLGTNDPLERDLANLSLFASNGLRTLCVACKGASFALPAPEPKPSSQRCKCGSQMIPVFCFREGGAVLPPIASNPESHYANFFLFESPCYGLQGQVKAYICVSGLKHQHLEKWVLVVSVQIWEAIK